jgi:hypothetical protein
MYLICYLLGIRMFYHGHYFSGMILISDDSLPAFTE